MRLVVFRGSGDILLQDVQIFEASRGRDDGEVHSAAPGQRRPPLRPKP
jgi:hypothetical protein